MPLRRVALAALIALVTLLLIMHLPPVSGWLVRTAIERVEGSLGLDIEMSGVSAWPVGLSTTLHGVTVRAVNDTEPFLAADALSIDLPLAAIRNRSRLGHITLARPRIDIDGLTRWLDSRPASRNPNPTVPRIDSLTITDATLRSERETVAFTIPTMQITLASTLKTPLGGAITATGATLRVGDVTFDAVAIEGGLRYDGAITIERARLTSHDTALDVDGRIGMREGDRGMSLTVAGTIAPLATVIGPYLSHPVLDGAVRIDGTVGGTFTDPHLVATLRSDAITIDGTPSGPIATHVMVSRERVDIDDTSWEGLFGGQATVDGTVAFDEARQATLDIGVRGVATAPIMALVDATWPRVRSRATGKLRITGPLAPGRRSVVTADMQLAPADASPLAADGRVVVTLDPRRWTTDLRATRIGGVDVSGRLGGQRLADPEAAFAESSLEGEIVAGAERTEDALALLRALDVIAVDLSSYQFGGPLSATATLSGTVRAPKAETIAEMPALTARDGLTGAAHATALIGRDAVDLHEARARLGDTSASMRGRIDLVARTLSLDTEIEARSNDAVIRLLDLPRHLIPTGAFEAKGRLTGSPDRPRVDASVTSVALEIAGQAPAQATGTIGWDGDIVTCRPCVLTREGSSIDVTGQIDLMRKRVEARGSVTGWAITPLTWPQAAQGSAATTYPMHADVSGRFDVAGPLGALTGTMRVDLRHTRWDTLQPGDITADITLAQGRASAGLVMPALAASGRVAVDQVAPYAFEATADLAGAELSSIVTRLGLDARGTTGRVDGTITASGRLAELDGIRGSVALGAFDGTWRDLPLRLERPSTLDWSTRDITTRSVALSLADVRLDIDGALSSRGDADGVSMVMSGRAEQIARILAALEIDAPAMRGAVEGRVAITGPSATPAIDGHLVITDGELEWKDVPPVTAIAADVRIADGLVTVQKFGAQAQDATVGATGQAPLQLFAEFLPSAVARRLPRATVSDATLDATLTNLTHGTVFAYAGERVPAVWSGGIDATAALTANRIAAGAVNGALTVTRATLAAGDLSIAQTAPARVRIQDGTLTLEPWRFEGSGTDVTASGTARLADPAYPYSVTLDGTVDLRLLGTVLPGRANGTLRSNVVVHGSRTDLDLLGRLDVHDANWIARELGLAITGLNGPLILGNDRITVDGLAARVNGGAVSAKGSLSTARDGTPSEVVFTGSGIALDTAGVVSEVSGEIKATSPGPRGFPYGLSGDVFVQPGIVRSSLRQIALAALDATSSGATRSPARDVMDQVALDVRVRTIDNLVADSNELKISVTGDVTLAGTLGKPGMKGALTATDEGELFFGGRLYRVTSGQIDFVDPNSIDPRLNIVADTRVAGYDVTMQMLGSPTDVTTRLTSDPPLSEGDLASLLATGRTLDERQGVTEEEAKTQLVSAVSSEYLGVLGRWFGLDTVRIEQHSTDLSATDLDPVARLNVSKSFGRSLDVLYSQSLSRSGDTAWVITYHTGWKRLDARATIQTRQNETFEVRQEVTFGGGAKPQPRGRRVDTRPRVVDVTFTGLDANDERDSRKQMRMEVGDRFDVYTWRRDQERIAEMFRARDRQRVTVSSYRRDVDQPGEIAIDYVVDPGPITTLAVTGATLSSGTMAAMRRAWSEVGIDEFLVDEWRDIAAEDLVAQGHVEARITPTVTTPGNPWIQRDGHVAIEAGRAVAEREIEFEGNALILDDQLRAIVETAGLDPSGWVRPALLPGPIRERYAALGHLETTVRVDPVRVEDSRAVLPVQITEGRQYLVQSLDINGERALNETAIVSALGLESGSVYLPEMAQRGADRVSQLYRREAFPDALVSLSATVDPVTASAALSVTINEGPRQVLAEVAVTGDTITSQSMLRHVTDLTLQRPLANRTVEDAQTRLYDTGIFRSVTPTIEPIGVPDASGSQPVRVTFAVEEQARYRLRYGLQATTNALADDLDTGRDTSPGASVDLRRNNLFGRGIFAGVGAAVTTTSHRVRFLVGSSTWFGYDAETTLSLERKYGSSSVPFDLERTSMIASGEQRWPLTRNTRLAVGYEFESTTLSFPFIDLITSAPVVVLEDTTELGSVSSTYTWDTRDNVFNPSHGLFSSARVEFGGRLLGSDVRFRKVLLQQYGFLKRRGVVFATAGRFGAVNFGEETNLATSTVRFRTGGATTVRGYHHDALSPLLFPDLPPGGDALLILNQEVRVPIWGWLGGVAFVDAGNTFPRLSDMAFGDLKVGAGGGLRLNTPFGIIRLDLGLPVREPNPTGRAIWYFGFGHAF